MDVSLFTRVLIAIIPKASDRTKIIKALGLFDYVGDDFFFQPRIVPINAEYIRIHNNVAIASDVTFCNHDVIHLVLNNMDPLNKYKKKYGCIEIMDNCFIGTKSIIMPNVRIGPNAIVAAGSVVTKDVPENSVVAGVPARVIDTFDSFKSKRLSESKNFKAKKYYAKEAWELFNITHLDGEYNE